LGIGLKHGKTFATYKAHYQKKFCKNFLETVFWKENFAINSTVSPANIYLQNFFKKKYFSTFAGETIKIYKKYFFQ